MAVSSRSLISSFESSSRPRDLPSFPTRRSSDLDRLVRPRGIADRPGDLPHLQVFAKVAGRAAFRHVLAIIDRKSTRLNSSHVAISYAVFCLKKKTHPTVSGMDAPEVVLTTLQVA